MIGLDEARSRVKAFIAGRENYIYQRTDENGDYIGVCCYFEEESGAPSCLLGQVFADELRPVIDASDDELNTTGIIHSKDFLSVFTPGARSWLGAVQMRQDARKPWGVAVKLADEFDLNYAKGLEG